MYIYTQQLQRGSGAGTARPRGPCWYSVYLLNWYKSTNTDAEGAAGLRELAVEARELKHQVLGSSSSSLPDSENEQPGTHI